MPYINILHETSLYGTIHAKDNNRGETCTVSKPVIITCDSTCDLSDELKERFDIKIVPLTITLGDETFLDGHGFTPADLFARYRADKTLPKTSAVGVHEFIDFFSPFLNEGYEVVHLDISSELSASFNNAVLAANELEGVYPVDSKMLSTGVALLAIDGATCRDKGMAAADIAARLTALTEKVNTSFVLDTLEFMWKGGRCTGFTALGANVLKLKPALEMKDGKLGVYKKYRGNINNVYKQYVRERLEGKKIRPEHVFVTESGEVPEEVASEVTELVKELTGAREVHHTYAGCTVATHCGPKTLGVLFIEE